MLFKILKQFKSEVYRIWFNLTGSDREMRYIDRIRELEEGSIENLTRELLGGIKIDFNETVANVSGVVNYRSIRDLIGVDDWDGFLEFNHSLKCNKYFLSLLKYLIDCQGNYCVRIASNEKELNFGRATINGIELIKDLIEELDKLYLEKGQKEKFDEFKVI